MVLRQLRYDLLAVVVVAAGPDYPITRARVTAEGTVPRSTQ